MTNELPQSRIRLALGQASRNIPLLEKELRSIRLSCHDAIVAIRSEGRFVRRIVAMDTEVEEKLIEKQLHAR